MVPKKAIIVHLFLLLSIPFGQQVPSSFLLDKEGNQYDLNQKMSINMQDSDIKNVLMLIGELTGLNMVVSPAVRDTITANLENVSIKAALDLILNPNGYSYFTQENIVIMAQLVGLPARAPGYGSAWQPTGVPKGPPTLC